MTKDQARRQIAAHERCADAARIRVSSAITGEYAEHWTKRAEHHEAAMAHYRKEFDIPAPLNYGSTRNKGPQRAETARIDAFKRKEIET